MEGGGHGGRKEGGRKEGMNSADNPTEGGRRLLRSSRGGKEVRQRREEGGRKKGGTWSCRGHVESGRRSLKSGRQRRDGGGREEGGRDRKEAARQKWDGGRKVQGRRLRARTGEIQWRPSRGSKAAVKVGWRSAGQTEVVRTATIGGRKGRGADMKEIGRKSSRVLAEGGEGRTETEGKQSIDDAEKPHLQALLDGAIKREQESEKERKEALLRRQVALLETVPSLTEEQCGEQLQSILTAFVQIRNLEDHTTQIAEVFANLQTLQDDLTEMTLKYHELTKEVADLRQAQVANPLPLPPGAEAAIETTSAPLTVSSSTSSSSVMATPSGPAAGADSTVVVTSNEAGTSAIVAAPRPEPTAAGPSHASPYVDRKAVQTPSKYDGKEDIESWIGSMRAYFEILGTQAETQTIIMGMNVEPVVRGFLEVQATRAGFQKSALAKWLRSTPVASLEELLISEYQDPHVATKARIQLDKVKHNKWNGSMKNLQTYLSKLFATPGLELSTRSCLDVVKGAVPTNFTSRVGRNYIAYTDWLALMKDVVSLEAMDLVSTTTSKKPMGGRQFKGSNRFVVHDLLEAEGEADAVDPTLGDDQEQDSDIACSSAHEQKPMGLLTPLPIPDGPGEFVSIDFTDMGKVSKNGFSQVMVIVDRFSKFLYLIPLPPHAPTDLVIHQFQQKYLLQFGTPKTLVSDRDPRFISAEWKEFTSHQGIKLCMTSGRHPKANGLAEEINHIVFQLLRALIIPDQETWDEELYSVKGLYNNSVHSATATTPNRLHYGWQIRNTLSYLFPEQPAGLTPGRPGFRDKYDRLLKVVVAAMTKRQHAMIHHVDKKRKPSEIQVGSYVWVKMSEFSEEEGVSRKLLPLYYEPWEVLDVIGEDHFGPSYVVDVPAYLRTYPMFHAPKLNLHRDFETFDYREDMIPRAIKGGHEIDRIKQHVGTGRNRQYQVHFRYHPLDDLYWMSKQELLRSAPRVGESL
ncbi:hypothetical protein CBR_g8444 [Chara braunii]|uniref:Integrase catalytic domain-containing protein n=1 Tax=Chara braunii TaxID=69332 RepID=A0A388KM65_CHABU|nr:hypothetical protein CBR_g8444 [Chara braunii]|eukprot:GBG71141.1 hypothetical protein CBR_g8444 [Chara braunii]